MLHHTQSASFLTKAAICFLSLSVLFTVACSGGNAEEREAPSSLDSFPRLASRWASPEIPVCWEPASPGNDQEKSWVRAKVEGQYEALTNVRFPGWETCTDDDRDGIRILVNDAGPHTKGLGKALKGVRNGMVLNFTFENWSQSCKANPKRCIESIGVHEFGHAIGLAHEQNRPDTPDTCNGREQGTPGDTMVGDWDLNSVMNYCNPVYNNNGNLTAQDIEGIARMY